MRAGSEREPTLSLATYRGAWPEEAIHEKILQAICGQEEPGSIMHATGSGPEQKSSNCSHQRKIIDLVSIKVAGN